MKVVVWAFACMNVRVRTVCKCTSRHVKGNFGIIWQTFLPLISFLPKKFNIHSKRFCQDDCAVFISSYPNILMFPSSIGQLLIILSPKHIISFCSFKLKNTWLNIGLTNFHSIYAVVKTTA
jgi:hypothetical protein